VLEEKVLKDNRLPSLRKRVAREAATLLYTCQEKEYKQAKKRAAKILRLRVLPSNLEIAEELDKIAGEKEGSSRRELLLRMRKEALQIMATLEAFNARLVGSVWRGTAYQNSDIDILAFSQDPKPILDQLQKHGYQVTSYKWRSVTKEGKKESSFHIQVVLSSGDEAEVIVRDPEKSGSIERCEIYGDAIIGLSSPQLLEVLKARPLQKFVPTWYEKSSTGEYSNQS
jgi:predicted nucleotidyltransferase